MATGGRWRGKKKTLRCPVAAYLNKSIRIDHGAARDVDQRRRGLVRRRVCHMANVHAQVVAAADTQGWRPTFISCSWLLPMRFVVSGVHGQVSTT